MGQESEACCLLEGAYAVHTRRTTERTFTLVTLSSYTTDSLVRPRALALALALAACSRVLALCRLRLERERVRAVFGLLICSGDSTGL